MTVLAFHALLFSVAFVVPNPTSQAAGGVNVTLILKNAAIRLPGSPRGLAGDLTGDRCAA